MLKPHSRVESNWGQDKHNDTSRQCFEGKYTGSRPSKAEARASGTRLTNTTTITVNGIEYFVEEHCVCWYCYFQTKLFSSGRFWVFLCVNLSKAESWELKINSDKTVTFRFSCGTVPSPPPCKHMNGFPIHLIMDSASELGLLTPTTLDSVKQQKIGSLLYFLSLLV